MVRQFRLRNRLGAEVDLNTSEHFLYDPKGMGYEWDNEYERIGHQYLLTEEHLKQKEPEGIIKFNSYEGYRNFTKFTQYRPLTLIYNTDAGEYFISIYIKKIEKTEKESGGWLLGDIEFKAVGQWYKYIHLKSDPTLTGKTYSYEYNFRYSDSSRDSVAHEQESVLLSPTRITFLGPCLNPIWKHYVNGELVASGSVACYVPPGRRLIVSSIVPYMIAETDAYGKVTNDRYQESDFSKERFISFRLGTNRVVFSHTGGEPIGVELEAYEYYDGV